MMDRIQKLLLVRPDRVGDVLIASSAFAPLREQFPNTQLYFAARETMKPLFDNHPNLSGFIPLLHPSHHSFYTRYKAFLQQLQTIRPNTIVHLHPAKECYLAAWNREIPVRIGYQECCWSWTLTHPRSYDKSEGLQHEAGYNFDLLEMSGVQRPSSYRYSVHLQSGDLDSLLLKLPWKPEATRYIVVNSTAYSDVARWPVTSFIELIRRFRSSFSDPIVLIGDSTEDSSIMEILSICQDLPDLVSLSGKTSLGELAWLLKNASLLVGRNTGPSHLAAAVGCPLVEIFGRTSPMYGSTRWKALGDLCVSIDSTAIRNRGESRDAFWKRAYATVSVDQVWDAILSLKGNRHRPQHQQK